MDAIWPPANIPAIMHSHSHHLSGVTFNNHPRFHKKSKIRCLCHRARPHRVAATFVKLNILDDKPHGNRKPNASAPSIAKTTKSTRLPLQNGNSVQTPEPLPEAYGNERLGAPVANVECTPRGTMCPGRTATYREELLAATHSLYAFQPAADISWNTLKSAAAMSPAAPPSSPGQHFQQRPHTQ